ncbi:MAG: 4Fe-4S ferredoxin [Thermodesulfatator sp.]|nr:MAG: 4Fe-4S ferredoxin [Thermodesulfatator sp.]
MKRRDFLKFVGLSAAVAGAVPGFMNKEVKAREYTPPPGALTARRWGLAIDLRKCWEHPDCRDCIEACHHVHNVPQIPDKKKEIKWIWKDEFEHVFPDKPNEFNDILLKGKSFLLLCNHCEHPPCVRLCPTQATFKREDGIVMMDYHRCIGCRFCMAACPFGARSFNWIDPRPYIEDPNPEFPTRMKGVVEKCLFCYERLEKGQKPACVEACKCGALIFGDLEDENSEISRVLRSRFSIRRKPELGTGPSVFYLLG